MSQAENLPQPGALELLPDLLATFGQQSQLDFEIEFFQCVLRRRPEYLDVLRCQGQLLSRKGLHTEALAIDRRVVQLAPADPIAHYNLACSLARTGDPHQAIATLRRAIARGYRDLEYLETDPDLDALHNEPAYRELLRECGREQS
jgi:tetratricopeptide (TPR) repeat protein